MHFRALAKVILKEDHDAEKDLVEANQLLPTDKDIMGDLVKHRLRMQQQADNLRTPQ